MLIIGHLVQLMGDILIAHGFFVGLPMLGRHRIPVGGSAALTKTYLEAAAGNTPHGVGHGAGNKEPRHQKQTNANPVHY